MDGVVKYAGVLLEHVLGAVSVVHIEIDDADPSDSAFLLEIACCNGHMC